MASDLISKYRISLKNEHMKDIYSSDSFLELGNIDFSVMTRLLSYEQINGEELGDDLIQKNGLGSSQVTSSSLKKRLSYFYFHNINKKNKDLKHVITCGILSYYNEENKQCFAPLVLIPVRMYFDDDDFSFVESGKAEINPMLPSIFQSLNINDLSFDKNFDSFSSIDRFCFLVSVAVKNKDKRRLKVSLENFLSYVLVNEKELRLDHEKFEVTTRTARYLNDKYYDKDEMDYYYSTLLTKDQRLAICNAMMGNNFTIVGRMGTGKTLTLFNIAMNLIIKGKKVLYISNMEETLTSVREEFEKRDLDILVADFSKPFNSLLIQKEQKPSPMVSFDYAKKDRLEKLYEYINNYEMKISSRILDYRFVEILTELAIISNKEKNDLKIDDLSFIYKHEYEEIISSLVKIENEYKHFCGFEKSIWKAIPIHNLIKDSDQISSLISQIYQCFKIISKEQKILEEKYGLKKAENFQMFKKTIKDASDITINDIPSSWLESSNETFLDAKDKYHDLKKEIYNLQETEYFLNYKYNNLSTINIKDVLLKMKSSYFTDEDKESINKMITNREKLLVELTKASIHKETYTKSLIKAREKLCWPFKEENKYLEIISRLSDFVRFKDFNKKLLSLFSYGNINNVIDKINNNIKQITSYNEYSNMAKEMFFDGDLDNINKYLSMLKSYRISPKETLKEKPVLRTIIKKHKYQDSDITPLIEKASMIFEMYKKIKQARVNFSKLTGERYRQDVDIVLKIVEIEEFLNSFSKEERKYIYDFLLEISDDTIDKKDKKESGARQINNLAKSYREINKIYNFVINFFKDDKKEEIKDINEKINEYFEYVSSLCHYNNVMYELLKDHSTQNVLIEKYYELDDELDKISKKRSLLENNEYYKFLYQNLYKGSETNINTISRVIQSFETYKNCYKDDDSIINSLSKDNYESIRDHFSLVKESSDNINEIFKIYSKIFNDGVSRFYYSSIDSTIEYLTILLSSKRELTTYLNITKEIRVLNQYKLNKLINYIIHNEKIDNLVTSFKYAYFSNVRKMFLEENEMIDNTKEFDNALEEVISLEKDMFEINESYFVNQIKKQIGKNNYYGINNLAYKKYIARTNNHKYVYLATTDILNSYLDISFFDVVLIDDAHLLNSNVYHVAIEGKQVIVAGEYQLQSTVSNNLISRMRHSSDINFTYRFSTISKVYLNHLDGLSGVIPVKYKNNSSVDIVKEEIIKHLLNLMKKGDSTANIFISDFHKQKFVIDTIARYLQDKNWNEKDIEQFLKKRVNISNLKDGYLLNYDYNVLYLDDYYDVDIEHISSNMIDNLLLAKKKVIIYDPNSILSSDYQNVFINELRDVTKKNEAMFKPKYKNEVENVIFKCLKEKGLKVLPSHGDINLIIEHKDKFYGIVILFSATGLNVEVLNRYRDYYYNFTENGWKMFLISIVDVANSVDNVCQKIYKEITSEN